MLCIVTLALAAHRYSGSMLGVSAAAQLDVREGIAFVRLAGLPLGGTLTGRAWLAHDGAPRLDENLRRALSSRGSRVERAVLEPNGSLAITLTLPLFGRRVLVMHPAAPSVL